ASGSAPRPRARSRPRRPSRRSRRTGPSRSSRSRFQSGPPAIARAREGASPGAANRRRMHNRALHDTLAAFVEEAASQLAEEVSGGAEVPFELIESPPTGASAPLYCYRPLTARFIAEHIGVLGRLPSYPAAAQGLAGLPDLAAYLQA